MDWNRIKEHWDQYRLNAKWRWDRLSDNELRLVNEEYDDLCAKIRQAYGVSRGEAELQIADWICEQSEPTRGMLQDVAQRQSQTRTWR